MVLRARGRKVEDAANQAAHDGRGKPFERIQAGPFPQEFARDGQQRIMRVPVKAGRVGETIACLCDEAYRGGIERPVRIGKMPNGDSELVFQVLLRTQHLLQRILPIFVRQQGVGLCVAADDHAGHYVAVPARVLREAVHEHVHLELAVLMEPRERVVEHGERTLGAREFCNGGNVRHLRDGSFILLREF